VLIDACGTAKLTDFGSFKNLHKFVEAERTGHKRSLSSLNESICWTAPEVLMKKSQGKPSDIWSLGYVVLEMLSGLNPWKTLNTSLDNIYKLITSGSNFFFLNFFN